MTRLKVLLSSLVAVTALGLAALFVWGQAQEVHWIHERLAGNPVAYFIVNKWTGQPLRHCTIYYKPLLLFGEQPRIGESPHSVFCTGVMDGTAEARAEADAEWHEALRRLEADEETRKRLSADPKRAEAERDIQALADVVEKRRAGGQPLPVGSDGLYMAWAEAHPGQPEPRDPLNGRRYVFVARGTDYLIVSLGRNVDDPADDVVYDSARPPAR